MSGAWSGTNIKVTARLWNGKITKYASLTANAYIDSVTVKSCGINGRGLCTTTIFTTVSGDTKIWNEESVELHAWPAIETAYNYAASQISPAVLTGTETSIKVPSSASGGLCKTTDYSLTAIKVDKLEATEAITAAIGNHTIKVHATTTHGDEKKWDINAINIYKGGYMDAVSKINYTSGAKSITVPDGDSSSKSYDITATYDAGYTDGWSSALSACTAHDDLLEGYTENNGFSYYTGTEATYYTSKGTSSGTCIRPYSSGSVGKYYTGGVKKTYYSKPSGGGCFVAGTPVLLFNGETCAIEDLKVGMYVCAYNEVKHEFTISEIESVKQYRHRNQIYDLHLSSGEIITLTHNHPVLTSDGWKAIETSLATRENPSIDLNCLEVGDEVVSISKDNVYITDIIYRDDLQDETVYNIDVEPHDNYIVNNIVVHNVESKT